MDDTSPKTVLVVDDEPAVRRLTATVLRRHGYDVIEADCGAQGLERFAECRRQVSLVLSDIVMPRMSGPEMVGRILALDPSVPVLFMTGHAADSGLPPQGPVLSKPFTPAALVQTISSRISGAL
ncbi:MAG TPA: response regulator [Candidatus Acidoferrales bacterium]|nr:response regulator [Candidatus Acidoferrales bacterium]